jgi:hypothetical protein
MAEKKAIEAKEAAHKKAKEAKEAAVKVGWLDRTSGCVWNLLSTIHIYTIYTLYTLYTL